MPPASQNFLEQTPQIQLVTAEQDRRPANKFGSWAQVAVAYALIEAALWTRPGSLALFWTAAAALCILCFVLFSRFTWREMGLGIPPARGSLWILLSAAVLAMTIPISSLLLGPLNAGATHALPFHIAWRYAIWSLVQQFILQSFLFVRLESLLGSSRAALTTAALFSAAHIPSPVLTVLGFLGGLFFCEMFRRYRNIFPLGVAHALFGLTIAASFSDRLLHHMRVGIGYLMFHP